MKTITKLLSFCLALVLLLATVMPFEAMASTLADPNLPTGLSQEEVFLLSILSNASGDKVQGSSKYLSEQLEEFVNNVISCPNGNDVLSDYCDDVEMLSDWELVWGPYVIISPIYRPSELLCSSEEKYLADYDFPPKRCYPANSMFVVKKDNHYLVAIAGTNPASIYDWFGLDFAVGVLKPWDENPDETGQLSSGTDRGLNNLMGMGSDKETLLDFLRNRDGITDITFAGHSLGGALAPVLALKIKEELENGIPIYVYPSAGPTPGNDIFAQYYNENLGDTTTRLWNELDVVPHAWNTTLLHEIPTLYYQEGGDLYYSDKVQTLVDKLIKFVDDKNYTHINDTDPENTESTVIVDLNEKKSIHFMCEAYFPIEEKTPTIEIKDPNLKAFLKQTGYQHTDAYAKILGVEKEYCTLFKLTGLFETSPDREKAGLESLVLKSQQ